MQSVFRSSPEVDAGIRTADPATVARVLETAVEYFGPNGTAEFFAVVRPVPQNTSAGQVLGAVRAVPRESGLGVGSQSLLPSEQAIMAASPVVLRILVMTAARDAKAWAAEIHADGYVSKPFELGHLLTEVERLCQAAA